MQNDATQDQIEHAYKAEARKRHPDGGGNEESMKRLNEARDVLSDPEARKQYDSERRLDQIEPTAPPSFDPYAASKAGPLNISVSDPEYAGILISTAACFGLGLPLLLLVELEWVFFLWPLRLMAIGALLVGVYMAHSALRLKQRRMREKGSNFSRSVIALQEIVFWSATLGGFGALASFLYLDR